MDMTKALDIAHQTLLNPAEISQNDINSILNSLMRHQIDFADVYFQMSEAESWVIEDGIIKSGSHNIDKGVGVRAISGEKTGFAYSDDLILPALTHAADAARCIAKLGQDKSVAVWQASQYPQLYIPSNPLNSIAKTDKIAILQQADQIARAKDNRVQQVIASLSGSYDVVMVAATDGTWVADVRPLCRLNVSVIVEDKGVRENGTSGGGGRFTYDLLSDEGYIRQHAEEAVRLALLRLDAKPAPAGNMPVVLGPGWPGVLLHEAIGHGLEGDFNRKGSSAFSGLMGQKVASELCTVVDDGTIADRRGSLSVDDEGTPSENTVLIENGILKNYMQDKMNASLMGMQPTGNGRRESYACLPLPRMTNTYMLDGPHDPEEIIASMKHGLYAVNFEGGQVDITSGKFVFSTSEAYLVENGKVTAPVKGAMLIGDGPEVLKQVSMVGNDLKLDKGVGVCGKEGQSVPVGVGQPTLKIDELTVGGTQC